MARSRKPPMLTGAGIFVIGSDQFYDRPLDRIDAVRRIVNAMPPDLVHQIGLMNPKNIYRLPA